MTNPAPSAWVEDEAGAVAPADSPYVQVAEADAQANDTYEQDFEAAQGYAPDPKVGAAVSAGNSISITGINANQTVDDGGTPQAVLAGSTQAQEIVNAYSLPIVGAATPTQQSLAQLAQRFDGVNPGTPDSQFPTAQ